MFVFEDDFIDSLSSRQTDCLLAFLQYSEDILNGNSRCASVHDLLDSVVEARSTVACRRIFLAKNREV